MRTYAGIKDREAAYPSPNVGSQTQLVIDENIKYRQVFDLNLTLIEPTAYTPKFHHIGDVEPVQTNHIFSGSAFYNLNKTGGLNK